MIVQPKRVDKSAEIGHLLFVTITEVEDGIDGDLLFPGKQGMLLCLFFPPVAVQTKVDPQVREWKCDVAGGPVERFEREVFRNKCAQFGKGERSHAAIQRFSLRRRVGFYRGGDRYFLMKPVSLFYCYRKR